MKQPVMKDDLNKSYQQIAEEEAMMMAQAGSGSDGGGAVDVFNQFVEQAAQETGNPPDSDGALVRATQLVLENVIAPMSDEELAGLTATDAAEMLFGFDGAAGEFGSNFDTMPPAQKRQLLTDIAGNGDTMMQEEQGAAAEQMMNR